jgi:hypothetical protein
MYWMHNSFVYFLCRLKMNHDSHERILEISTVANTFLYNTRGYTRILIIYVVV